MNKQQLASKIWASANKMRSKVEPVKYKDFILGLIFYKFLSEQEVRFLKANDSTDDDIRNLSEDNGFTVNFVQENLGYFIAYDNLYSTWVAKGAVKEDEGDKKKDNEKLQIKDIIDGMKAFQRLIHKSKQHVFDKIFLSFTTGITELPGTDAEKSKMFRNLVELINLIPNDYKSGYDFIGYIYEYLIGMFAANAGKKAGEFYSPVEASRVISDIAAYHICVEKGYTGNVTAYDSCSGSAGLLLHIGKSCEKYWGKGNKIKYFAQELNPSAYNLTRMNLIMRGIDAGSISVRNADTLGEDWPVDDVNQPGPLRVLCAVSNPPYSQRWSQVENDPRFDEFGIAPKGKADYAFLLHDLYHLDDDGIMGIILPHGVLFRGNEEAAIRKSLIEKGWIDAIVGLPANVFYGTGIPTIIIFLKKKRNISDILIVDASKGFEKKGKNNVLRECDIKKIFDVVTQREEIEKYSRRISMDEIRKNDYNLNIPRYVDSSEPDENWDIRALMEGGIPSYELDSLKKYWDVMPSLRNDLFRVRDNGYFEAVPEMKTAIVSNDEYKAYFTLYKKSFEGFEDYLDGKLLSNIEGINIFKVHDEIAEDIFNRVSKLQLADKYEYYQAFSDNWNNISYDLDIIESDGMGSIREIEPNMVIKKDDNDNEIEVQKGWKGKIMPFELVQTSYFLDEYNYIVALGNKIQDKASEIEGILENIDKDEAKDVLNDNGDAFATKELNAKVKEIRSDISTPEIKALENYLAFLEDKPKKNEKLDYIENHPDIAWTKMISAKDGTYGKKAVSDYIAELKDDYKFDEDTLEGMLIKVAELFAAIKALKAERKSKEIILENKTIEKIKALTDEEVHYLLNLKWVKPLVGIVEEKYKDFFDSFYKKLTYLAEKYIVTLDDTDKEIADTERELLALVNELGADNADDLAGIKELKVLLGGE